MHVYVVDYHTDFFSSTVHAYGYRKTEAHSKATDVTPMVHLAIENVFPIVYVPFPGSVPSDKRLEFAGALRLHCSKALLGLGGKPYVLGIALKECKRAIGFRDCHTVPMLEVKAASPWAVRNICNSFAALRGVGKFRLDTGLYVYNHSMADMEASLRYNLGMSCWSVVSKFRALNLKGVEEDVGGDDDGDDDNDTGNDNDYDADDPRGRHKRRRLSDDDDNDDVYDGEKGDGKKKVHVCNYMENYVCDIADITAVPNSSDDIPKDMRTCVYDIETTGLWPNTCVTRQIVGVIVDVTGKIHRACGFTLDSVDFSPSVRNTLKEREAMMGVPFEIVKCPSERAMIKMFFEFAMENAMLLCGYNTHQFDFPFMAKRCPDLKLGRLSNSRCTRDMKPTASGHEIPLKFDGMPDVDMKLVAVTRYTKLDSYTLDNVVKNVLKKVLKPEDLGKDDVPFSEIHEAFTTCDPLKCGRVLVYCLWDVLLTLMLMKNLNQVLEFSALSNIVSMPFSKIVTTKNRAKIESQIMKRMMERGYVLNTPFRPWSDKPVEARAKFQGATVLEPEKGFHCDPAVTLDFSSLYPSIIIKHRLCVSTALISNVNTSDPNIEVFSAPHNKDFMFAVNKTGRTPIIPEVLAENIARRKAAQAEMKKYPPGSFQHSLNDSKQWAIKIHSNATYGVLGDKDSILFMEQIASTVTAFGRQYIETAIVIAKDLYNKDGKEHVTVLYGDTDSIMIKFSDEMLKTKLPTEQQLPRQPGWTDADFDVRRRVYAAIALAKPLEERVLKEVGIPMKNEGCKVNWLLSRKKGYAATVIEHPDDPVESFEVKISGLDVIRRDQPGFVRVDMRKAVERLAVSGNVAELESSLKEIANNIATKEMPLDYYTLTVGFNRTEYVNADEQVSIQIFNRMMKTMPNEAPQVGDRIKYVVILGPTASVSHNARHIKEMPHVKEKIDRVYYLTALANKVDNIFGCMPEVNKSVGEHIGALVRKLTPPCRPLKGQTTLSVVRTPRQNITHELMMQTFNSNPSVPPPELCSFADDDS